jgi:hypothetical protein
MNPTSNVFPCVLNHFNSHWSNLTTAITIDHLGVCSKLTCEKCGERYKTGEEQKKTIELQDIKQQI